MDRTGLWMALAGAFAATLALVAWIGDHRRMRRTQLDQVGFMPWTDIFFWALMAAVVLLGVSLPRLF
jgi:cell division protein FtsX